ncbi:Far1-related sequence 11-like protein, partial [Thalictrum thalictroides]
MSEGTSLVVETSENDDGTEFSADESGTIDEMPLLEDTILSRQTSVNLVPFIGQRFVSQDAAYEFYCSFSKQCGFSIRRHRTRGKDGVGRGITRRDFTCHRGGYPQMKPSEDGKLQRNRRSSRCGCPAYMRIVKKADFDVPEWRITGFSNIHNHELLKSNQVHLLPAYCSISADDKSRICMFAKAGMSVRQMLRLMELEKGVKLGCLPFTEIDTFIGFMKGNAPKTILTDQNMWLKDSVSVELPITKHAFCIWHILAKFSDWFSVQLGSKYDNWKAEFHRLYNLNSVDEFEVGWSDMINAYGLHGNKHIISLYALRTYWALPFLRSHFFAGMTSASQAESINVFIQRILFSQSQLDRFVEQ